MDTTAVRTAWEYRLEPLEFSPLDFDDPIELNSFGAEGWELISVQANPTPGAAPFLCFFKRPKL